MRVCLALLMTALLAGSASADVLLWPYEVTRHKARMGAAETQRSRLTAAVESGATPKARRAARQLRRLFVQEEKYWLRAGLDDALALARHSLEAADKAGAAAEAGDRTAVRAATDELSANCVACHQAHPERRLLVQH
jgi:hypothetical protein